MKKIINGGGEDAGSLFIITDSESAAEYAVSSGAACAGLMSGNLRKSFSGVLYCIEDIEFMTYEKIFRMWQRYHGIPWTIAVTERLVIMEHSLDDVAELYGLYDDEAAKYTEAPYDDPKDEAEYLERYIKNQYRFYEFGTWALRLRENNKLIGRAGINLRDGYDIPEIGYIIGKGYRGQGYAKEAVSSVIGYGMEEFGFDAYMAFTKERNIPSVRLLESLGFEKRGHGLIMGSEHAMYILTKMQ
ncbi:MAG: GNAT family N-acetyltransferase [Lachnospiraceae bacterium]|nr:GNAT family N-acetyltransferase [Lachnospiraceae bacterium]